MEQYDYLEAVTSDVYDRIVDGDVSVKGTDRDEIEQDLHDEFWVDDCVTGNASGSYTCNSWEAEENICHNTELIAEMASEFGDNLGELFEKGAETIDVCLRCYVLPEAISDALDRLEEEHPEMCDWLDPITEEDELEFLPTNSESGEGARA